MDKHSTHVMERGDLMKVKLVLNESYTNYYSLTFSFIVFSVFGVQRRPQQISLNLVGFCEMFALFDLSTGVTPVCTSFQYVSFSKVDII